MDLNYSDNYFGYPKNQKNQKDKQVKLKSCQLCSQSFKNQSFSTIGLCLHFFCTNCLKRWVQRCLKYRALITCPIDQCQSRIQIGGTFFKILSKQIQQKIVFQQKEIKQGKSGIQYPQLEDEFNQDMKRHRVSYKVYRQSFAPEDQNQLNNKQNNIQNLDPRLLKQNQRQITDEQYFIAKRIVEERQKRMANKKENYDANQKQRYRYEEPNNYHYPKQDGQIYNHQNKKYLNQSYQQGQNIQNKKPLLDVHQRGQQIYLKKERKFSCGKLLIYPIVLPFGILVALIFLFFSIILLITFLCSIIFGYLGSIVAAVFLIKSLLSEDEDSDPIIYIVSLVFALFMIFVHRVLGKSILISAKQCFYYFTKFMLKSLRFPCPQK